MAPLCKKNLRCKSKESPSEEHPAYPYQPRLSRSPTKQHQLCSVAGYIQCCSMFTDVFLSEVVFEAFGELVIQGVLLFRFRWLVTKADFSSFGLSFQIYVLVAMGASFVTMVSAILTYNSRGRSSLRKKVSLHTASLVIFWTLLLVTKVAVYVFGFMNNPGLFWVPMIVKMFLIWLFYACGYIQCKPDCNCVCNCACPCRCNFQCKTFKAYKSLPGHDKFVFIMISTLVPVSIPSKGKKSVKGLQMVSIILFLVECLCVLLFAYVVKYFYHFELFQDFYGTKLPDMFNAATFDGILVVMVAATFSTILVASFLPG